ncbi:hypothetical protein E2542_SST07189 [Spatholobus suberectus]|nr:hypothetical protein E2542_SST07189 [Spatholobus suberectus]
MVRNRQATDSDDNIAAPLQRAPTLTSADSEKRRSIQTFMCVSLPESQQSKGHGGLRVYLQQSSSATAPLAVSNAPPTRRSPSRSFTAPPRAVTIMAKICAHKGSSRPSEYGHRS